jgi:hypothetical protein
VAGPHHKPGLAEMARIAFRAGRLIEPPRIAFRAGNEKRRTGIGPGRPAGAISNVLRNDMETVRKSGQSGKPLAREVLDEIMKRSLQAVRYYYPFDAQGQLRTRERRDEAGNVVDVVEVGHYERFIECASLCSDVAGKLAAYQSPKLQAIAIAPPQKSKSERIKVTLNIFGPDGGQIGQVIDGEAQDITPPPNRVVTHNERG